MIYYVQWHSIKRTDALFYTLQNMRRALIRIHKNYFLKFFSQGKMYTSFYFIPQGKMNTLYNIIFIAQVLNVFLVENKTGLVKRALCMFQPPNVGGLLQVHSNLMFSLLQMHYYTN